MATINNYIFSVAFGDSVCLAVRCDKGNNCKIRYSLQESWTQEEIGVEIRKLTRLLKDDLENAISNGKS